MRVPCIETTRLPSTALYEEIRRGVLVREDVPTIQSFNSQKVPVAFPAGDHASRFLYANTDKRVSVLIRYSGESRFIDTSIADWRCAQCFQLMRSFRLVLLK